MDISAPEETARLEETVARFVVLEVVPITLPFQCLIYVNDLRTYLSSYGLNFRERSRNPSFEGG